MVYLYCFSLFFALIVVFCVAKKDFLSPTVITVFSLFMGSIFSLIGSFSWADATLSFPTILVVHVAIFAMMIGELFARRVLRNRMILNRDGEQCKGRIKIPLSLHLFFLIVSVVSVYLYYQRVLQIAISQGYRGSLLLNYIRMGINEGGESIGWHITILTSFSKSLGYICIFIFIRNFVLYDKKSKAFRDLLLLVQAVPSFVLLYLASSRYVFLKIIVFAFVCTFLLLLKYKTIRFKAKYFLVFSIVGAVIIFGFYRIYTVMGVARGSFSTANSLDKFIMYAGSSIFGLDSYIVGGMGQSNYFGEETLVGLYSLINRFFQDFPIGTRFLEAYPLNGGLASNVYIMIRSLIADYTFLGMLLIEFLIGFVFTYFYLFVRYRTNKYGSIVVYSYFCYGLVFQLFAPLMISDLFSVSQILELAWIVLLMKFINKHVVISDSSSRFAYTRYYFDR